MLKRESNCTVNMDIWHTKTCGINSPPVLETNTSVPTCSKMVSWTALPQHHGGNVYFILFYNSTVCPKIVLQHCFCNSLRFNFVFPPTFIVNCCWVPLYLLISQTPWPFCCVNTSYADFNFVVIASVADSGVQLLRTHINIVLHYYVINENHRF